MNKTNRWKQIIEAKKITVINILKTYNKSQEKPRGKQKVVNDHGKD